MGPKYFVGIYGTGCNARLNAWIIHTSDIIVKNLSQSLNIDEENPIVRSYFWENFQRIDK